MLIGIIVSVFLFFASIKDKDFKNLKYIILIGPFIIGAILYGSVFILTKDIPVDACDGGALMGLLISYIFIGIGILLNLGNLTLLFGKYITEKHGDIKYRKYFIIIGILVFTGIIFFRSNREVNRNISKDLEIKVPYTLDFHYQDSHGGFHGDGITLAKAKLKDIHIEKIVEKSKAEWNRTPMPKNIELELYGGQRGDINWHSDLADKLNMPNIERGYWIFLDRSGNRRVFNKGENLFPRVSANYSLGVIDSERNIFYYIKFDS